MVAVAGDKCMKVVENQKEAIGYEHAFVRAKAIKGLIELVDGNVDSCCTKGLGKKNILCTFSKMEVGPYDG